MPVIVVTGQRQMQGPVGIGTTPVSGIALGLKAPGSTALSATGGVIHVNTTDAGNTADTNEDTIWTYSLPAGTLARNGDAVRVTVGGTFAANANVKTVKGYFGATIPVTFSSNFSGLSWNAIFLVVRTGAATQVTWAHGQARNGASTIGTSGTGSETLSGAVVIKVTGQTNGAAANDVTIKSAVVEFLPAPSGS